MLLLFLIPESVGVAEKLVVTNYWCGDSKDSKPKDTIGKDEPRICQIGERVTAKVKNLEAWMKAAPKKHTLDNLVLALDGIPLVGSYPLPTEHGLRFELVRKQKNEKNMAAWKMVSARTVPLKPEKMTISIALEGTAERYGLRDIEIRVASENRLWTVGIVYLVLLLAFLWLVANNGLLRDVGPKPPEGKKPFSLGATQMAFWFFIVFGGFLYVWLVAGDLAVLTPGVLGLIGISAATGLVATSVATAKKPAVPAELSKLEQEKIGLDTQLNELEVHIGVTPTPANLESLKVEQAQKKKRLAVIEATITELTTVPASAGFFQDILSTGGEVSLPRFQMMAWTLVLGIVFLHSVFTTLNMPEFDAVLLGLMGLSSGTYVGFKFPSTTGK